MKIEKLPGYKPAHYERVQNPNPKQCCRVPEYTGLCDKKWRETHYAHKANDPQKCQRNATLLIDGKPLCRPHAGQYVLEKVLKGELK